MENSKSKGNEKQEYRYWKNVGFVVSANPEGTKQIKIKLWNWIWWGIELKSWKDTEVCVKSAQEKNKPNNILLHSLYLKKSDLLQSSFSSDS